MFVGHFLQKSPPKNPIISDSFAERDLQLEIPYPMGLRYHVLNWLKVSSLLNWLIITWLESWLGALYLLYSIKIGLFWQNVGLFRENVGLFRENVGLFRENVGLFWSLPLTIFLWRAELERYSLSKERYSLSKELYILSTNSKATGWRRPIGCLKLQAIFRKRANYYRALLRKMTYDDKASYGSSPPCTQLKICQMTVELTCSTFSPYILSKEPYILSKEPYILSKKPYILPKEPYILSKEPYVLSKEQTFPNAKSNIERQKFWKRQPAHKLAI